MPKTRQRLLDLLAIGRVANLPTVWSNVIVGNLLAWATLDSKWWGLSIRITENFGTNLTPLLVLLLGATCAYLFGTFLNDWKDSEFDRQHRPERAIPAGRFTAKFVLGMALAFLVVSLTCFGVLALESPACLVAGLALLAGIVLYTVIHKKTPLGVLVMGLCRSLLYLCGFFIVFVPQPELPSLSLNLPLLLASLRGSPLLVLAFAAIGILSYVAGLTLAARYESRPEGLTAPRIVIWLLIFLPLLSHSWWWIWVSPPFLEGWHLAIPALIGLLPFVAWTTRALVVLKKSIPDFVSRALAGLCLVDLLAYPGIAASINMSLPFNTPALLLALLPMALFILALLLQRLAPAT